MMHDNTHLIMSVASKLSDGIVTINDEGKIIAVNEAAANFTGYSKGEMVGQSFAQLFAPSTQASSFDQRPLLKILQGKEQVGYRSQPRGRDLTITIFPADEPRTIPAITIKAVAVIRNNNQLAIDSDPRAARIQMIGHFATGVAHDINNDLTAIMCSIQIARALIKKSTEPGFVDAAEHLLEDAVTHLTDTETISRRTATFTKQLLAYARQKQTDKESVNLNSSVKETLSLVSKIIGEKIKIETNLAELLPPVLAERSQIDRILTNLILNARDAMPSGGVLRIETTWCYLDENFKNERPPWAKTGRYVHLSITDTGKGMSPQTLRRIYEEFFTTKAKGTGVGLRTVYQIVKDNSGMIEATSELGKGTRFDIYLPPSAKRGVKTIGQDDRGEKELIAPHNKEDYLILVGEAHKHLREVFGYLISRAGYSVELFADGQSALASYRAWHEQRRKVALTILDVGLPLVDGRTVKDEIHRLDPRAAVILTGSYDEQTEGEVKDYDFLRKPCDGYKFLEMIELCLEKSAQAETQLTGS